MQHRNDIQGLRAVAVGLVVAAHGGVPGLDGGFVGVDVFFVLSGFLITSLLIREHDRTGQISLLDFWARRARRILPAACLVLAVTAVAANRWVAYSSRLDWREDIWWAAGFAANWRFASQGTDYLQQDQEPSVVQHYWSLGVEEQFYVVFPLLILLIAVIARNAGIGLRRPAFVIVAMIGGASLAWSIHLSASNVSYAYFSTPSRAWQLAVGALLAFAVGRLRTIPASARTLVAAGSLVTLVASVLLLGDDGQRWGVNYPSWLALGPTLAAAGLIAAGIGGPTVIGRLLSSRPLTYVGDLSFSWYLWHWPFIIIGAARFGDGPLTTFALVAASFGASVASYHLVENPIRHWPTLKKPALSLAVGAAAIAVVIPTATMASAGQPTTTVLSDRNEGVKPLPALDKAATDLGPVKPGGCQVLVDQPVRLDVERCTFGDRDSDQRVVVIGDSIAAAMSPGVIEAGRRNGWAVTVIARSRCAFIDATTIDTKFQGGRTVKCRETNRRALALIEKLKPLAVVTSMSYSSPRAVVVDENDPDSAELRYDDAVQPARDAQRRYLEAILTTGARVVAIDSSAKSEDFAPTKCLDQKGDAAACTFTRVVKPLQSVVAKGAEGLPNTVVLDPNTGHCRGLRCGPLAGRYVVYRDDAHFTATYATTFADQIAEAIRGTSG